MFTSLMCSESVGAMGWIVVRKLRISEVARSNVFERCSCV